MLEIDGQTPHAHTSIHLNRNETNNAPANFPEFHRGVLIERHPEVVQSHTRARASTKTREQLQAMEERVNDILEVVPVFYDSNSIRKLDLFLNYIYSVECNI